MNLVSYSVLLVIGTIMWWRSGVLPTQKYFLIGFGITLVVWWFVWGQIAVYDQWWIYNDNNVGGLIGMVPAADMIYFLAGLGWFFYLCHKLELF